MAPAFSTSRQATAFALLVLLMLSMPEILASIGYRDRRSAYTSIPVRSGIFSWVQQKIFLEEGDVDIAFLGSSRMWGAIDARYVQKELSQHIGRESEVFTFGWPWSGFDAIYFIARDLMDHRHVHVLVVNDETKLPDRPHTAASRWYREGEHVDAMDSLTFMERTRFYAAAVLGAPRHILGLVREDLIEDPAKPDHNYWYDYYHSPNITESLGSRPTPLGFGQSSIFEPYSGSSHATPADAVMYSPETRQFFDFKGPSIKGAQLRLLRKLADLCKERGTRLVFIHLPSIGERNKSVITEQDCWPEVVGSSVEILGVPPNRFFAGVPDGDEKKFFYESRHLNQNGQEFLTRLITPSLVKIYDTTNDAR